MTLREPFMVKTAYGDTAFSLEATTGKSLLVTDIFVFNPANDYITISVEKTTVGYWRVGGKLGNHLPLPIGSLAHSHDLVLANEAAAEVLKTYDVTGAYGADSTLNHNTVTGVAGTFKDVVQFGSIPAMSHRTVLGLLRSLGHFKGYPVEEGQTMIITGAKQAGALVMAFYQEYDAGDMKRTDPNGSEASEFMFCNYGRVAADLTNTGSTIYNISQSPEEYDAFPFGERAPANKEIDLLALLASDIVDDRGGNDTMNSEYLKFVYERTTWFDPDKNGLLLKGLVGVTDAAAQVGRGLSIVGNQSDVDGKPPFIFDPPRTFGVNEELGIYIVTTAGAAQNLSDLLVADTEIGLIERIRRVK